jgi:hypothetical protein
MFSMFSTKKVKKEMPRRCEMTEKEIDDMLSRSTQRTKTSKHTDKIMLFQVYEKHQLIDL